MKNKWQYIVVIVLSTLFDSCRDKNHTVFFTAYKNRKELKRANFEVAKIDGPVKDFYDGSYYGRNYGDTAVYYLFSGKTLTRKDIVIPIKGRQHESIVDDLRNDGFRVELQQSKSEKGIASDINTGIIYKIYYSSRSVILIQDFNPFVPQGRFIDSARIREE